MIKGVDISHFQGDIQWQVVKDAGFDFVFMKATQNIHADPTFTKHWNYLNLKDFGIIKSAYHFFDTSADPTKQAEAFCFVVGTLKDSDLPLVVDIEEDQTKGALSLEDRIKNLQTFLDYVEKTSGKKPIIYTNRPFFKEYFQDSTIFKDYLLWFSAYPDPKTFQPSDPPPDHTFLPFCAWDTFTIWQYTEAGTIPGADNAGNTFDFNVFPGNLDDLKALC